MEGYLAGIPGKLKTLSDRLSATWAAKLDALRAGLSDARMGYLDKLNVSGSVASTADVTTITNAISGRAASTTPILKPPIALVNGFGHMNVNYNATFVSAVDITGQSGVLAFVSAYATGGNAVEVRLTIDGVVVFNSSASGYLTPVGFKDDSRIAFESVPFTSSLKVEHRPTGSAAISYCDTKYRRTA